MASKESSGDRAPSARRSLDDDLKRSRRAELAEGGTSAKPNETPSSDARTVVRPSRRSKEVSLENVMASKESSGDRAPSARRSLDDDLKRSRRAELAEGGNSAKPNETPSSDARTVVRPSRRSKEVSLKTPNERRKFDRNVRIVVKQCGAVGDSTDVDSIDRLLGKISIIFEEADDLGVPEESLEQLEEFYAILDERMFALRKGRSSAREDSGRNSAMPSNEDRSSRGDDVDAEQESRASKREEALGLLRLSEIERDQFGWETAGDGVQLRDEVKLEAGRYARAARSPPVVPIETSLSVFVAGLRAKLGSSNLKLGNFRSSTRFKFAKSYVKYAKRVANLVRESAKGDFVDACFFLLMPSVTEAVGYETSELIRGMGSVKSCKDFEDYVFMTGKFASEDKPGDPNEALASIKNVTLLRNKSATRGRRKRGRKDGSKAADEKDRPWLDYPLGSYVLVARLRRQGAKIAERWTGPYLVIGCRGNLIKDVLRITADADTPLNKDKVGVKRSDRMLVHCDRLKLFSAGALNAKEFRSAAQQERIQSLEVFIEKIVNHRIRRGELEFEVSYIGFPDPCDNSWEPEQRCIAEFEEQLYAYIRDPVKRRKKRIKELYERLKTKRDAEAVSKREQETAASKQSLEDFEGVGTESEMLSYAAPIGSA